MKEMYFQMATACFFIVKKHLFVLQIMHDLQQSNAWLISQDKFGGIHNTRMSLNNISGELNKWIFQVVGVNKNAYQLSSRDIQDDAMSSVVIMMIITKIPLEISVKC